MPAFVTPAIFMRNITQGEAWHIGALPGMAGATLFPIGQGSDTDFSFNFGPFNDPHTNESIYAMPRMADFGLANAGYSEIYPGWKANPGTGRAWTAFDPARASGTAVLAGNRLQCPVTYGACQAADGWNQGGWFFTIRNNANTLFNNFGGGGAGRAFPGIDYSFWANDGQYGAGDVHGGGVIIGGHFNTYLPRLSGADVVWYNSPLAWNAGELMGFAVSMAAFDASVTYDGKLIQQPMPCIPCCLMTACLSSCS